MLKINAPTAEHNYILSEHRFYVTPELGYVMAEPGELLASCLYLSGASRNRALLTLDALRANECLIGESALTDDGAQSVLVHGEVKKLVVVDWNLVRSLSEMN